MAALTTNPLPAPVSALAAPTPTPYGAFTAPDPNNFAADPSYKFTLNQGLQALQNSAAARGTLLTGATGKAEQDYGQQSALQGYQQAYSNALSTYNANAATNQQNFGQANAAYNDTLAGTGQAQNFNLATNGQAFNQGQTQYQDTTAANQYATAEKQLADTTAYDRARTAWVDAGSQGPLYGGYQQPLAPQNSAAPMSLAASSVGPTPYKPAPAYTATGGRIPVGYA